MQPSQTAIQRELEALRDIRRRSTAQGGPGALILDPDLPVQQPTSTPPLSPQAWTASDESVEPTLRKDSASSSNGEGNQQADDPFHLFWVPAHLHPELAPSEFRAFLKEHARGPVDGAAPLSRSSSASTGLGRKSSMLSRQYRPRDNESPDEERVVPVRRNRSIYAQDGPQLTIGDLQKLEELAEEASKSDDPTKLRRVIRRSLSLNVAPSFLDQMDDVPDTGDDADAPIIVPKPNQILRRAARTKIRKPGLAGDGGGHRFPATRRKSGRAATIDAHGSGGRSSGEHSDSHRRPPLPTQKSADDSAEEPDYRRITFTEESLIYDAYADGPDEKDQTLLSTSPPPMIVERPVSPPPIPQATSVPPVPLVPPVIDIPPPQQPPTLYQPQPQHTLSPVLQSQASVPSRSPSPDAVSVRPSLDEPRRQGSRSVESPTHPIPSPVLNEKRKDKDKKSLLRKWGGGGSDKSSKKGAKEKERDRERDREKEKEREKEREKEKEKDSGFFGSLFGKKKQEEPASSLGNGSGPATAAALLGASKASKALQPSLSPQLGNPYARYPIHVERAVYRLSHIKLANPRRPLYEQVLISNLMFWYLGVINKAQQGPGGTNANGQANGNAQPQGQLQGQDGGATPGGQPRGSEEEYIEREQQEREDEGSDGPTEWERDRERERDQRSESARGARRVSLTKQPAPGSSAAVGRRAETPVKGPQYGLQHQVIEQEYGPGLPSVGGSRASSASTSSLTRVGNGGSGYARGQAKQGPASREMYAQPDGNTNFYYGRSSSDARDEPGVRSPSPGRSVSPPSGPPPGAMSGPVPGEHTWLSSVPSSSPGAGSRNGGVSSNHTGAHDSKGFQRQRQPRSPPPPSSYNNSSHDWAGDWTYLADVSPGAGTGAAAAAVVVGATVGGGGRLPSRSLSANAAASPVSQQHGAPGLKKKVASAMATSSERRQRTSEGNEEEDVPLAVWQQQRRR